MELSEYPRPHNDTGRGVHWSSSPRHWGQDNWSFWRDVLIETNVKWVKVLHADDADLSALPLCKRLIDLGIMPIVRHYIQDPMPMGPNINPETIKKYVSIGALYHESKYNEWDNPGEWSTSFPKDFNRVVDILIDNTVREWEIVTNAGGIYIFPAASFGGKPEYDVPQRLVESGYGFIFDKIGWGIHNYEPRHNLYPEDPVTKTGLPVSKEEYDNEGHPWVDWHWSWEITREEVNRNRAEMPEVASGTDNVLVNPTGFRAFDWLNYRILKACKHPVPIFGTESGTNVHATFGGKLRWPYPTPYRASVMTYEQFKYVEALPPDHPYIAHCVWLAFAPETATDYRAQGPWFDTWYDSLFGLNGELPLVQMLRDDPGVPRVDGPVPEQWPYYKGPSLEGRNFDDELKYTNPPTILRPVPDPSQPHWRLQGVSWQKEGTGHAFVRCIVDDDFAEGVKIRSFSEAGAFTGATKGGVDNFFGDVPVPAISDIFVFDDIPSDILQNVWEGTCHLTFVKSKGENKVAFNVLEVTNEMLTSSEVILPDDKYEIAIEQVDESQPGVYWKVVGIRHLLPEENNGNHHCYLGVFDENGQPIKGALVYWDWAHNTGAEPNPVVCDKPYPLEPMGNLPIAANMESVEIWVEDEDSKPNYDRVYNIRTTHPDEEPGNTWGHHSFYIVYKRVVVTKPVPPEPDPEPEPGSATETLLLVRDKLKELQSIIEDWKNG